MCGGDNSTCLVCEAGKSGADACGVCEKTKNGNNSSRAWRLLRVAAALLLLYCCFTAALLLLYCCFTAALLLLYCCAALTPIAGVCGGDNSSCAWLASWAAPVRVIVAIRLSGISVEALVLQVQKEEKKKLFGIHV
jgi:hypothetical protein